MNKPFGNPEKNQALFVSISSLLVSIGLFGTASYAEVKPTVDKTTQPKTTHSEKPQTVAIQAKSMLAPTLNDSFKKMDKNGDSKVSFDEYYDFDELQKKQRAKKEIKRMMSQCDKNGDGSISKDELTSEGDMEKYLDPVAYDDFDESERLKQLNQRCMFPQEAMDFLDMDGNGSVSREEMAQMIMQDRRPSKKMERKLEKRMQKREAKRKRKEFSSCDKNADQLLSLREVVSMKCSLHLFTEQFDAYDKNKDQLLTVEELTTEIKPVEFRPPGMPSEAELRKKMSPLMRLESAMYECDKDEDGRLGKNETIDARCEQDMVYFDTVDHDQDGYISQNEIQRMRMKKRFTRMDKNKNGFLDAGEMKRLPPGLLR
jgi:Ca2+-binding EF-hand superfamily protein